jgi:osmotically-inducible protein OsmY
MKSDLLIQQDVVDELKWAPLLSNSEIGVHVKHGVVTLSGSVDSFAKQMEAEKAAKRVAGVKAVVQHIQVGIAPEWQKSDEEISIAVENALNWHTNVQPGKIKVAVQDGNVRMTGEVEWEYQRGQIQTAVESLIGIRSIANQITVRPKISTVDVRRKINSAFQRSANIDAEKIEIEVQGSKVILSGHVRSFAEKEDAELAAWNAPGVTEVESNLEITLQEYESG